MIRVGSDVGVACDDTEIRGVVLCEEDEEVVGDGKEGGRAQRRWCVELEGSEEEIVVNEEQLRVLGEHGDEASRQCVHLILPQPAAGCAPGMALLSELRKPQWLISSSCPPSSNRIRVPTSENHDGVDEEWEEQEGEDGSAAVALAKHGLFVCDVGVSREACAACLFLASKRTDEAMAMPLTTSAGLFGRIRCPARRSDLRLALEPPVEALLREVTTGLHGPLSAYLGDEAELVELAALSSEPGALAQDVHSDTIHGGLRSAATAAAVAAAAAGTFGGICGGRIGTEAAASEDIIREDHDPETAIARLCTCFIAVHDIKLEMGPTIVYPGTHTLDFHRAYHCGRGCYDLPSLLRRKLPREQLQRQSRPAQREQGQEQEDEQEAIFGVHCDLKAGSVVCMDSRLFHGGGANYNFRAAKDEDEDVHDGDVERRTLREKKQKERRIIIVASWLEKGGKQRPEGSTYTLHPSLQGKITLAQFRPQPRLAVDCTIAINTSRNETNTNTIANAFHKSTGTTGDDGDSSHSHGVSSDSAGRAKKGSDHRYHLRQGDGKNERHRCVFVALPAYLDMTKPSPFTAAVALNGGSSLLGDEWCGDGSTRLHFRVILANEQFVEGGIGSTSSCSGRGNGSSAEENRKFAEPGKREMQHVGRGVWRAFISPLDAAVAMGSGGGALRVHVFAVSSSLSLFSPLSVISLPIPVSTPGLPPEQASFLPSSICNPLRSPGTLCTAPRFWERSFRISGDRVLVLREEPEPPSQGANNLRAVGYRLWDAGVILAECLRAREEERIREQQGNEWGHIRGRVVVELGSGVGLGGIAAAALGAKAVTLTDVDDKELLSLLTHNVRVNQHHFNHKTTTSTTTTAVSVRALDWTKHHPDNASDNSTSNMKNNNSGVTIDPLLDADVLIAADVLYDEASREQLVALLVNFLTDSGEAGRRGAPGVGSAEETKAPQQNKEHEKTTAGKNKNRRKSVFLAHTERGGAEYGARSAAATVALLIRRATEEFGAHVEKVAGSGRTSVFLFAM